MINKKLFGKILSLILVFQLLVNPALVRVVFAEEIVEPTPTPESTITTGDPSASSGQAAQSSIETGNASSEASVQTTANTNQDTLPGEITTPPGDCTPPEGETSCPTDVTISNDNSAQVSDSTGSTATTGENQITGSSGDTTISTGDATASGTIENEINSNTVILEPSPTPSIEPEALTASDAVTVTVENNNEGTVQNEANINASTGENLASENLGDAQIETGDALALANLLTLLNTNILGSNFEVLLLNLLDGETGDGSTSSPQDIDLNELWKKLQELQGSNSLVLAGEISGLQILVQNQNQADLENNVNVSAGTGENQANENNNAGIETGDATALANVTNVVNTNILGSNFFFGVINILDADGNLILPRPERFGSTSSPQGASGQTSAVFENDNQAEITDQVGALAETGANEENGNGGDNLIVTGNAIAHANSFSLVNLNIFRNNWFFLIINNLGNWQGKIFGWSAPEAVEEPSVGSQVYQLGLNPESQTGENGVESENFSTPLSFQNQNQARVRNNIQTSASTGENQASQNQGNASIQTGNARSLANLFNLVNLNILGGRFFMGIVNILGDWSGSTIFAYPDVAVGLSAETSQVTPGETLQYILSYKNLGYDEAQGVRLGLELPEGLSYLSDTSGLSAVVSGQNLSWSLGQLGAGKEGSFTIMVKVNSDFSFEEPVSWLSKFIPKAYAAENEKEKSVVVNVQISTSDPESNSSNNSSSTTTMVYLPHQEGGVDPRQPVLEISAWNNVNEFVYPGDTVTFEITVKNTSDVSSYNTRLIQRLYNGVPEDFGTAEFDLGTIEPGKGGKLSFGLKLADDGLLPAGPYYTIAQAFGNAPNGNEVSSNESRTNFEIKVKNISSLLPEAKAVEAKEGVLGSGTAASCPKTEDILPYVLLLLLSSGYIISWAKPRLKKGVK
ncbi:MAG: hypothetical protein ACOZBZ_01770 [Patescibacteria group bacterium]